MVLFPAERLVEARAATAAAGLDALLVAPGADLRYLTGYDAHQLERLTLLVVPAAGEPTLIVPRLERPAVPDWLASPPQTPLRRTPAAIAHPTLLHAALSSHLSAVSRTQTGAAQAASRAAGLSAVQAANAARLVSIRRPARIPRRPSHRCPHNPE